MPSIREINLNKLFPRISLLSETREGVVFESRTEAGEHILVNTTRGSVSNGSSEERSLIGHLDILLDIYHSSGSQEIYCGIDRSGIGFWIVPWFDSNSLTAHPGEFEKVLSIFTRCIEIVSTFHDRNIAFGDICPASFRVTGINDYRIVSVLGDLLDSKSMSGVYLPYISPEQKITSQSSFQSDLYSLGVFGYHLLTGEYAVNKAPTSNNPIEVPVLLSSIAPSNRYSNVPQWFDTLLANCLVIDPKKRIKSLSQLLDLIKQGSGSGHVDLPHVAWQTNALVKVNKKMEKPPDENVTKEVIPGPKTSQNKENAKQKRKSKTSVSKHIVAIIWGVTSLIGFCIAIYVLLTLKILGISGEQLSDELRWVYEDSDDDRVLKDLVIVEDDREPVENRILALRRVVKKKIQWDIRIVRHLVKRPFGIKAKEYVSDLPEYHGSKLGYDKVTSEMSNSLRLYESVSGLDAYFLRLADYLSILDPLSDPSIRSGVLRNLYRADPEQAVKLAGLFSIESDPGLFSSLLREFIATRYYDSLPRSLSGAVLFLLAPPLRPFLEGGIEKTVKIMETEELRIVADSMLASKNSEIDLVFELILSEYLLRVPKGNFSRYFLDIARDEVIRDPILKKTLYRLALETATDNDLRVLLEWNDSRWEDVLTVICITSKNEAVLSYAMEILSRRGVSSRTASAILDWLKGNLWQKRAKYAFTYGVFVLRDKFSEEDIQKAFDLVMPVSQHGLFTALVSTGDPYFVNEAVLRIGPIVPSAEVFPLLSHEMREVRIASIKALTGRNDIETLRRIARAYRNEKDQSVRKLYNEIHWVTLPQELPESIRSSTLGN
ncbi:MAG TPA: hypothetical protein PKA63_00295 [Oligoflexia bacterium]|nr:hypothetical protein [Oligoflexia bacterium]HMP47088.1 hypothetical protein [Oligoflexia bacterium]